MSCQTPCSGRSTCPRSVEPSSRPRTARADRWAQLSAQVASYLGTELLASLDVDGVYLTVERWASESAFDEFTAAQGARYRSLEPSWPTSRRPGVGSAHSATSPTRILNHPIGRVNVRPRSRRRRHRSSRSRGSVEERPLHTRKVAGSNPAGTTPPKSPGQMSPTRCMVSSGMTRGRVGALVRAGR